MDSEQLPDDLADLERELAERIRAQPSEEARERLLAAVERELASLSWLRRHRRLLVLAGGLAAAVILALLILGRRNGPVSPNQPIQADPSLAAMGSVESDDALLTWRAYRRVMDQSPEDLERLLEKKWVEKTARSMPSRVVTRANSEFLSLNGDSR